MAEYETGAFEFDEKIRKQAYAEGYEKGFKAGYDAGYLAAREACSDPEKDGSDIPCAPA